MSLLKTSDEIRPDRRRTQITWSPISVACLWPKNGENLGTTLRTCDAVGARLVVPRTAHATKAIRRGNTIGLPNSPIEYIDDPYDWLAQLDGRLVAVELAHGSIPLADLAPADGYPTTLFVGHENMGVPDSVLARCDQIVEIPMFGVGNSLNVGVATALVLYKLAGLT